MKPWEEKDVAFVGGEGWGKFIAAAPAMARALCLVEWFRRGERDSACEACWKSEERGHASDCPLDAALTAAGLTPEDREAVRRAETK